MPARLNVGVLLDVVNEASSRPTLLPDIMKVFENWLSQPAHVTLMDCETSAISTSDWLKACDLISRQLSPREVLFVYFGNRDKEAIGQEIISISTDNQATSYTVSLLTVDLTVRPNELFHLLLAFYLSMARRSIVCAVAAGKRHQTVSVT
jgi:hypothetical protein